MEMGVCFHGGPFWGTGGGRFFPRAFERRVKFYQEKFYEEHNLHVEKALEMSNSLHKDPR